jgi:PAS domain S-box-containing protein
MSKNRCDLVLDTAIEGFWDWDVPADTAFLSPRYRELLGYAAEDTAFNSSFFLSIIHPDDVALLSAILREFVAGERTESVTEFRIIRKDGSILWVRERARVVACDAHGRPTRMVGSVIDITDHKLAEVALQASHDLLHNLSDQVPGVLFQTRLSPDGHFSTPYASRAINDIYDIPSERIAEDATPVFETFHPDDHDGIMASIMESARTLQPWEHEYRVILPRHGVKWLRGHARPMRQADGGTLWYGFITDITDRKLMEVALKESEERYRRIFEVESDAIFLVSRKTGRFIDANSAATKIYGYSREEFLTMNADDVSAEPEQTREQIANGQTTIPLRWHRRKDGTLFPVEISGSHFDVRGDTVHVAAIRDITARERTAADLRQSENRYRAIVESQTEFVDRFLPGGILTYVNSALANWIGRPPEELIGKSFYPFIHDSDRDELIGKIESLSCANPVMTIESRVMAADGTVCWQQWTNRAICDDSGRIVEYQSVGRDITERKDAEAFLAQAKELLEDEVRERTAALSLANEQLTREIEERKWAEQEIIDHQRQLEALGFELSIAEERERARIAGELHDQVGQCLVLGKIKIYALASLHPSPDQRVVIEELERLLDKSIQDIRSLTFQLRPPILATAGLEAAVKWLGEELKENYGLLVDCHDDRQPKPLSYEIRSYLFQAVRELLLNVAKHAGTKGAQVSFCRDGDSIVITVADDGAGFDMTHALAKRGRSAGFGLFNVQQRIEYLGGRFMIESLPGKGSRATIVVPLETLD